MPLPTLSILALAGLSVAVTAAGCTAQTFPEGHARADEDDSTFRGRVFDASGKLTDPVPLARVVKTDEEWQAQLSPTEYDIVRDAGTERPFTGPLLENKAEGVYQCVACRLPLFASDAKFESGTGWPSFFRAIARENVGEKTDRKLGLVRTEILCARCEGHLGHVFEDGPRPTGLRYCVNSASLAFTPRDQLDKIAEDPAMMRPSSSNRSTAVFAGGCFWCVEAVFEELDGVSDAISGYAGGTKATANYKEVCSGRTKHAEAVQIVYDPSTISYEELLRVHFATHDPTQKNRQGNDVGPQYRSAIFYVDEKEKKLAGAFIEDLDDQDVFDRAVVTTLEPLVEFFPAEQYHQNYVCNNPTQGYVRSIALPKVEKVRKAFKDKLKKTP